MAPRRISTPHDLGAAVRDARTAAQLTQAELAERAGVSREWLIGLERGTRPRAELTKILHVLATLDQPLMLGRDENAEVQDNEQPTRDGAPMTTAEVTRRAIEQSWPTTFTTGAISSAASAAVAQAPTVDISAVLPKIDLAAMRPWPDFVSLMPQLSPALVSFIQKLNASQDAAHGDDAAAHDADDGA
ncbi:MAG: helix-turn-helix domain-containing protein [Brachybacterium sp.]|nr:helix-turn-helix domain-containing protein [Brachybacterium sp.]